MQVSMAACVLRILADGGACWILAVVLLGIVTRVNGSRPVSGAVMGGLFVATFPAFNGALALTGAAPSWIPSTLLQWIALLTLYGGLCCASVFVYTAAGDRNPTVVLYTVLASGERAGRVRGDLEKRAGAEIAFEQKIGDLVESGWFREGGDGRLVPTRKGTRIGGVLMAWRRALGYVDEDVG